MLLPQRLQLRSFAPARPALWRLVTAAVLLAVLAQPGLAPLQAAPAPNGLLPAVAARPAPACTLLVSSPNDTGPGSLRQAVACALAGQTVTFAGALTNAVIQLSSEISITVPLAIDGSGAPGVRLDGGGSSRIFSVAAGGPVTLTALVLQHGSAPDAGGAVLADAGSPLWLNQVSVLSSTAALNGGGAIHAAADLTLNGGLIQNNRCPDNSCLGGGLYTDGALTLTGTQVISNTGNWDGGGAFAQDAVTLSGGRFERNNCTTAGCYGGALYVSGSLTLAGTQFLTNTSRMLGGAVYADGGALANGLFQGNSCSDDLCNGGGLYAFYAVVLTDTNFISNTSQGEGGGLEAAAAATVTGSTFTGNTCLSGTCEGAGLSSQGSGFVSSSTFNGNTASGRGGGLSGRSTLTVVNSTLSGNHANLAGGGVLAGPGSTLRLINVTVADNSAGVSGGGVYSLGATALGITNTIFAYNGASTCDGLIAAGSHNLEWPGATCHAAGPTAGFTTADALLGPLALNPPGATMTRALLPDSPARDAGDAATCAGPEVNNLDQRGVARPIDGDAVPGAICDIGAYEASALPRLYLPLVMR